MWWTPALHSWWHFLIFLSVSTSVPPPGCNREAIPRRWMSSLPHAISRLPRRWWVCFYSTWCLSNGNRLKVCKRMWSASGWGWCASVSKSQRPNTPGKDDWSWWEVWNPWSVPLRWPWGNSPRSLHIIGKNSRWRLTGKSFLSEFRMCCKSCQHIVLSDWQSLISRRDLKAVAWNLLSFSQSRVDADSWFGGEVRWIYWLGRKRFEERTKQTACSSQGSVRLSRGFYRLQINSLLLGMRKRKYQAEGSNSSLPIRFQFHNVRIAQWWSWAGSHSICRWIKGEVPAQYQKWWDISVWNRLAVFQSISQTDTSQELPRAEQVCALDSIAGRGHRKQPATAGCCIWVVMPNAWINRSGSINWKKWWEKHR